MSWQAFVASLVKSLAWPAVLVAFIVIFREQLRPLLKRPIKRAKFGSAEVEWQEEVAQIAEEAQAVTATAEDRATGSGSYLDDYAPVVDFDPGAAVLGAWARFDSELRSELDPDDHVPRTAFAMLRDAEAQGLQPGLLDALSRGRRLRNQVAHGYEVSHAEAVGFLAVLDQLARALSILRHPGGAGRPDGDNQPRPTAPESDDSPPVPG